MLRLDVNRKVLQCIHCRTKCNCEVVATFLDSEIDLFTVQDLTNQVVENQAVLSKEPEIQTSNISNPVTINNGSFIIDFDVANYATFSSRERNMMLNDLDADKQAHDGTREATLSVCCIPPVDNFNAWKGHNDDGIPIIDYNAMFGHKDKDDLDLQLDCRV